MVQYAKENAKILPDNFEENIESLLKNLFTDSEKVPAILQTIIEEVKKVC